MIKPKAIEIIDIDGVERKFIITRFPATVGIKFALKGIPSLSDTDGLLTIKSEIFSYVYVETAGGELALKTDALVDNHCGDAETALKVIGAMLTYNFQTLGKLTSGGFLESVTAKIPDIARKLLTQLQPVLSEKGKQRSGK